MRPIKRLKFPLILCLIVLGAVNAIKLVRAIPQPDAYRKDFFSEYLLARAVIGGLPAYTPLPKLAEQLMGPPAPPVFPHPSPHPPPVLLVAVPFGFFSYRVAMILWLIMELTCLYLTCWLIIHRFFNLNQPGVSVLLALGLFCCFPVFLELSLGQLMLPMLLVLTIGWLALRSNRDSLGGAFLGLTLAIKFIGWPLFVLLILRKRWKAVLGGAGAFLAANLVAIAMVGVDQAVYYYRYVGPPASRLYRSEFLNFSTWAAGDRLVAGTSHNILQGLDAQPLVNWPAAAPLMIVAVTAAVLFLALLLARSVKDFDSAFAVLVCASTVVNPIAWHHYLVLLVIPAAVAVKALSRNSFPGGLTFAALVIGVALLLPHLDHLASSMAVGNPPVVSAAIGLLSFIPLIATLGLMVLVWRVSRAREPEV